MEEPEAKKMKAAEGTGDEEMTVQFEDENGEGHELGPGTKYGSWCNKCTCRFES